MTQFSSVFGNMLTDINQNNLQQQIPQSNNVQQLQGKQIDSNVCQQSRNGQNDYGIQNNGLYNNQQHVQQSMMDSMPNPHASPSYYNNCYVPGSGKQIQQSMPISTIQGFGYLPQSITDQMRSYLPTSSPIFILPNGTSNSNTYPTYPVSIISPTCIPYPMPLPIIQPPVNNNNYKEPKEKEIECKCLHNKVRNGLTELYEKDIRTTSGIDRFESCMTQYCNKQNKEEVVCTKINCTASIQLQAIASQLLGIHGIISATITRLLLKQISNSNVTDSEESIMKWGTGNIQQMTKDQLLKESKICQEVNGLLSLYLTSSSTLPKIIPILTSVQLKSNILKAIIENLINAKIMEDQGYGVENPEQLDALLLELKSDDELRDLISILREKECQERVNLNFTAYRSQRLIAKSKLSNVQRKIGQIEKEMNRRHSNGSGYKSCKKVIDVNFFQQNCNDFSYYKSNDLKFLNPFSNIHLPSPKKLLLKPHVGSPETTYTKPDCIKKSNSIKSKFQSCSSFCEKNSNEEKCYINSWENKNSEENKSANTNICNLQVLENLKENNNNSSLMDYVSNVEKIQNLQCSILKCKNFSNKNNQDDNNELLTDVESNISTNQIQKKNQKQN